MLGTLARGYNSLPYIYTSPFIYFTLNWLGITLKSQNVSLSTYHGIFSIGKKHLYWFWGIIYCWEFFSINSIINISSFFQMKKNLKILVELIFSQMWNLVKQLVQIFFSQVKNSYKLRWLVCFKFDFFGEFSSILFTEWEMS